MTTTPTNLFTAHERKFAANRFVYPFKGTDYVAKEYRTGRAFSLSLSYKLGA